MLPKLVKYSFEVIKKDCVRHTFEDESKFPERIDATDV